MPEEKSILDEVAELKKSIERNVPLFIGKHPELAHELDKVGSRIEDAESHLLLAFQEMESDVNEFEDLFKDSNYSEDDTLVTKARVLSRTNQRLVDCELILLKILATGMIKSIEKFADEKKFEDIPPIREEKEEPANFDDIPPVGEE